MNFNLPSGLVLLRNALSPRVSCAKDLSLVPADGFVALTESDDLLDIRILRFDTEEAAMLFSDGFDYANPGDDFTWDLRPVEMPGEGIAFFLLIVNDDNADDNFSYSDRRKGRPAL